MESTQVGHLLFSRQFEQTKIEDLSTCPEFGESQTTSDYLDSIVNFCFPGGPMHQCDFVWQPGE